MRKILFLLSLMIFVSCTQKETQNDMDTIAEKFVKLVLRVGQYDPAVVDAYHGPEEWKPAELNEKTKNNYPTTRY